MITYRMSHAGTCPRALSAERLGLQPETKPEYLETAAKEGKKHEDWIVEELLADDITVTNRQEEVHLKVNDNIELLGHIDGIIFNHTDEQKLLEIKTMSQYEFDRWMKGRFEEFPQYAVQLTCYMTALGLNKAIYIVKNRNSGYIDKQEIVNTPADIESIKGYLISIEESIAQGRLIEREYNADSTECRRCSYKMVAKCIPEIVAEESNLPQLISATNQWREYKAMAEEAEDKITEAENTFLKHGLAINKMKWTFDQLGINILENLPREYYDKNLLEAIFPIDKLAEAKKQTQVKQKWSIRIRDYKE